MVNSIMTLTTYGLYPKRGGVKPIEPILVDVDLSRPVNEWAEEMKEAVREYVGIPKESHDIYFHAVVVLPGVDGAEGTFSFNEARMTNAILETRHLDRLANYADFLEYVAIGCTLVERVSQPVS